uniref:Rhodanese domain-containing protein n=1 Tax=viral metagenome TaxID=1070528 RepID=A0A6C0C0A4_9ZZZZ
MKKASIQYINYQNMQQCINDTNTLIINTLNSGEQECLILNTLDYNREQEIFNQLIDNYDFKSKKIVIYGKNCNDNSIMNKANQLINLGFQYIYVYIGGLFEWILLQEIYSEEHFKTTSVVNDILKYKPTKIIY